MRRILVAAAGTLSGLGLIFLYPTSTGRTVDSAGGATTASGSSSAPSVPSTGTGSTASDATGSAGSAGSTTSGSTTGSGGTGAAPSGPTGTYSASTSMRYGTVTVTVTLADGRITDASATQDSQDGHSRSISAQAIPTLNTEALDAQSADIALVSHATYTSEAYAQSLQAALDEAAQS